MNNRFLTNMSPLASTNYLRFQQESPFEKPDQKTESVSEGYYAGQQEMVSGLSEGILSALGAIAGAYTKKRQQDQEKSDAEKAKEKEFERMKELARIMKGS